MTKKLIDTKNIGTEFIKFFQTIQKLRDPESGCPWDLKQTHKSLKKYLIEESYEAIDAIENGTKQDICDELGDVLLQVVLHAQLALDQNDFSIIDVIKSVNEKMIRRHPHVFENQNKNISVEEVKDNWQQIKDQEKPAKSDSLTPISKLLNKALKEYPANQQSIKIGKICEKVGFDWPSLDGVMAKVDEELGEVKQAIKDFEQSKTKNRDKIQEELGDLYFSIHQLTRKLKFDPEVTSFESNLKFIKRFNKMETAIINAGKDPKMLSLDQYEEYWQSIKK